MTRWGLVMFVAGLAAHSAEPAASPLFSEDFESPELDPKVWSIDTTGGNIVRLQSDRAAHGRQALLVRCPEPSNRTWAFATTRNLPAALRTHHFGRVYMYIAPKPPARHTILIMAGTPGFPRNKFLEVATTRLQWQLTYVDLQPEAADEDYRIGGEMPLGRWFCLEWEFNDRPDRAAVWVDGQPTFAADFVAKKSGGTSSLVGGFEELALGFRLWGAAPEAFEIYYDDLVLDVKRVGARAPASL